MKYDDAPKKHKTLPKLEEGENVKIHFVPVDRETKPPEHYTIETLNNYLKNPFKEDKNAASDDDSEDYRAIFEGLELGTEATRTGIIDNARKSKYIELKKDVYLNANSIPFSQAVKLYEAAKKLHEKKRIAYLTQWSKKMLQPKKTPSE